MTIMKLSVEDVLLIRSRMAQLSIAVRDFGSKTPLYEDKLHSAVERQSTSFGGHDKYTRLVDVGGTLFFGLVTNHAFENGNKRTALVSLLVLLGKNQKSLSANEDEIYDLATTVAEYKTSPEFSDGNSPDDVVRWIASWLRSNLADLQTVFQPMKTRKFLNALESLGCSVGRPDRSFVNISPPPDGSGRAAKMAYGGGGVDIPASYIKQISEQLGITLTEGYTPGSIYNMEPAIDTFVNQYRQVLDRLALT